MWHASTFSAVATPLILLSALLAAAKTEWKMLWTALGFAGGGLMLAAGVLYGDRSIIALEIAFMGINGYGFYDGWRRSRV